MADAVARIWAAEGGAGFFKGMSSKLVGAGAGAGRGVGCWRERAGWGGGSWRLGWRRGRPAASAAALPPPPPHPPTPTCAQRCHERRAPVLQRGCRRCRCVPQVQTVLAAALLMSLKEQIYGGTAALLSGGLGKAAAGAAGLAASRAAVVTR